MKEQAILALADAVRTITVPGWDTGHAGAWALDFGLTGEVRVSVLASLADAPGRPPRADEIFVWLGAPLTPGEDLLRAAADLLDAQEQAEARCFHQAAHRCSFIAAHAGLRSMLGAALSIRPLDVHTARGPQGKPHLCAHRHAALSDSLHFNISHTKGLVAVALAGRPVGIDVEARQYIAEVDRIARLALAPESVLALKALPSEDCRNAMFYRFWTLGEAFIKATGLGVSQGLDSFAFTATGVGQLTRVTPTWGPPARWRFGLF